MAGKLKNSKLIVLLLLLVTSLASCKNDQQHAEEKMKVWQLGWRMIESSWEADYQTSARQFDSLLAMQPDSLAPQFLMNGLMMKSQLGKEAEIKEIVDRYTHPRIGKDCLERIFVQKQFDSDCDEQMEVVKNEALRQELIGMYVDDQAARGNVMNDLIREYSIDSTQIIRVLRMADEQNFRRLKEIIHEFGFPNREMIGKEAMEGVFFIIQHVGWIDQEWQRAQLPQIEKAVKRGDLEVRKYAFLIDRVQVNAGEPQLYGTQFVSDKSGSGNMVLAETEDPENLDRRRMEMGLMPIDLYRKQMFRDR